MGRQLVQFERAPSRSEKMVLMSFLAFYIVKLSSNKTSKFLSSSRHVFHLKDADPFMYFFDDLCFPLRRGSYGVLTDMSEF